MILPLAAAALSAGLTWLAFPPVDEGWVIWFALAPALAAARGATAGRALLVGLVWGVVFLSLLCGWLVVYSPYAPAAIAVGTAPLYAAATAAYARRPTPLVAAAAWTAAEWLRSLGPLGFTWGDLGYALWRDRFLVQAADLGGVLLLTAAVAWTNAALAEAAAARSLAPLRAGLLAPLFLVVYALLPTRGGAVLPGAGPTVAIVQPDLRKGADWAADPAASGDVLRDLTRRAARPETRLFVWPETVVRRYLDREPALRRSIGGLAAEVGAPILVGAPGTDEADRKYNAVFLVEADGRIAGRYDKVHLVPVGEFVPFAGLLGRTVERLSPEEPGDFTAAETAALVALPPSDRLPAVRLGVLVCFEAAFGRLARRLVLDGADVLVAITNDGWSFSEAAHRQHFATNVVRAVETRRWLLRCANTGISAAVSPAGEVVASLGTYERGVVEAPLRPLDGRTLYVRLGDWPGPLSLLILAAAWASSSSRRRSSSTSPSSAPSAGGSPAAAPGGGAAGTPTTRP